MTTNGALVDVRNVHRYSGAERSRSTSCAASISRHRKATSWP